MDDLSRSAGREETLMNSSNFNTSCVEVPRAVCSFVLLMWPLGIHEMLKVMCATSRTSARGVMGLVV